MDCILPFFDRTTAGNVAKYLTGQLDDMPGGGKKVLLEITDSGAGFDEATKNRLFQPFFTTKEPEKGTGLGLASVQRLMLKMGGSIVVESQLGQGTTFRMVFPAVR